MTKVYIPLLTLHLGTSIAQADTSDLAREQFAHPGRESPAQRQVQAGAPETKFQ
jgi:hypothetical protein